MTTDSNEQVLCKYCSSSAVIKHGTRRTKSGEIRQRYLYCLCNRISFIGDRRFIQDVDKRKTVVIQENTDGKSFCSAAKSSNVSPPTVQKWIVEITDKLQDFNDVNEESIKDEDPLLPRNYIIDEMWHFVFCKQNKLWCIKNFDETNNKLVDYELGWRDEDTVLRLYNRIRGTKNINFYSDDW